MSWRLGLGLLVVAALSVAAAVIATMSVTGPHGAARIKAAIRWPASCTRVAVDRPSHAQIMHRWASFTLHTADIVCGADGPGVAYAQFRDDESLDLAVARYQPIERYCQIGASIVIDELAGADPAVFADMCRNLGGTFVNPQE